jgi:hypothetical protein
LGVGSAMSEKLPSFSDRRQSIFIKKMICHKGLAVHRTSLAVGWPVHETRWAGAGTGISEFRNC